MTLDLGEWKTTPDCQNWPSSTQANQSALAYVTADVFSIVKIKSIGFEKNPTQNTTMRLLRTLIPSLLLAGAQVAQAASSWSFDEAVISASSKGAGVAQFKEKYVKPRSDLIPI